MRRSAVVPCIVTRASRGRKGELYLDEGKKLVFPHANGKSMMLGGICRCARARTCLVGVEPGGERLTYALDTHLRSYLVGGNVKKADKRVKAKGVAGNTKGEGMKLGGCRLRCGLRTASHAGKDEAGEDWEPRARWGGLMGPQ